MNIGLADSKVRSLFVSDLHLGSRYCQPRPLQHLLETLELEHLYIVGDFCDGWLLRRNWNWQNQYSTLIDAIGKIARSGAQVTYVLGNHDRCLQRWVSEWGDYRVVEACRHECADGRKLLVIHGDQFDATQKTKFRRAAEMSALLHERILGGSRLADRWLADIGVSPRRLATALTTPFKSWAHRLSDFRGRAEQLAKQYDCDGVLCGHTHAPALKVRRSFLYANCGDWLENCSAIVETSSGQLELWQANGQDWFESCRRRALVPANTKPKLVENCG